LRANSAAKVAITTDAATDAIVVPAAAVTLKATNAAEGTVMVVDEESVTHETKVTVGIRNAEQVQITAGLQGGETVVIEGNYALPDGTKVKTEEGGDEEDEKKGGEKEGGEGGAGEKPAARPGGKP